MTNVSQYKQHNPFMVSNSVIDGIITLWLYFVICVHADATVMEFLSMLWRGYYKNTIVMLPWKLSSKATGQISDSHVLL